MVVMETDKTAQPIEKSTVDYKNVGKHLLIRWFFHPAVNMVREKCVINLTITRD